MSESVTITSTIKFDLEKYSEAERLVLEDHGEKLDRAAKEQWRGWFYGKQNRPPTKYYGKPGTSRAGWQMNVTAGQSGHLLELVNVAKDPRRGKGKGKAYAGYIHRVGKRPEDRAWFEVLDIVRKSLPELETQMAAAALEALTQGQPARQLLTNKPSEFIDEVVLGGLGG